MYNREEHSLWGSFVSLFSLICTETEGNHNIDTDTETHGNGVYNILNRKYERKCSHGIFADLSNENAVNNVIKWIYQHG